MPPNSTSLESRSLLVPATVPGVAAGRVAGRKNGNKALPLEVPVEELFSLLLLLVVVTTLDCDNEKGDKVTSAVIVSGALPLLLAVT